MNHIRITASKRYVMTTNCHTQAYSLFMKHKIHTWPTTLYNVHILTQRWIYGHSLVVQECPMIGYIVLQDLWSRSDISTLNVQVF